MPIYSINSLKNFLMGPQATSGAKQTGLLVQGLALLFFKNTRICSFFQPPINHTEKMFTGRSCFSSLTLARVKLRVTGSIAGYEGQEGLVEG